jgi:hypothetical protein
MSKKKFCQHALIAKVNLFLDWWWWSKLVFCLVVVEQSAKMHAVCTTCTTLSHIRNLRSKVVLFLVE